MAETLSVTLPEHWLVYARGLVSSGRFASLDHAMEDALRSLEAADAREERLERLLEEGEQSGDAGPWDLQAFLSEAWELDADRQAA